MKALLAVLFLLTLTALPLWAQTNAPVRLAIVSETEDTGATADLLTVQLSSHPNIQLLERDQIAKVYQELSLSATGPDYLKLGQELGADGLLILHLAGENNLPTLELRLLAVKPGVTLDAHEYPWPLAQPQAWSEVAARQLEPLLPKLAVLPEAAVRISILNLHSAEVSATAQALEQQLTLMLYDRLIQEPRIFVLERRRMELLTGEKERLDGEAPAFWNGSLLLDGLVDKDGYRPDQITIDLQLIPPGQKNPVTVAVTGSRQDLPAVMDEVVSNILTVVNLTGQSARWDAAAEAARYNAEARWLFKWKMFQEAKAAGESAWALGDQTPAAALLRIQAWLAAAGDPGSCGVDHHLDKVVFGRTFNQHATDYGQSTAYASVPNPAGFAEAIHAAILYSELFPRFAAREPKLDTNWLALGVQVLDHTSWWLRYYYFTVEARPGSEDYIQEAKQRCQEITAALEHHPDLAAADNLHSLLQLKARHSAFWVDTPEQGLTAYQGMLEAGQWPLVRSRFFNTVYHEGASSTTFNIYSETGPGADQGSPCLAGWKWPDRQRGPQVWSHFIDELCASPKPLISLEGQILRCSDSWSEADFEQNLGALLNTVRLQQPALADAGLAEGLRNDLTTLVESRLGLLSPERSNRIQTQLWNGFKDKFRQFIAQHQPAPGLDVEPASRVARLELKKRYLTTQTNFERGSFMNLFVSDPDPANYLEAKELLPLLTNYAAKVTGKPAPASLDAAGRMMWEENQYTAGVWIGMAKKALVKTAATPPPAPAATPPRVFSPELGRYPTPGLPGAWPTPPTEPAEPALPTTVVNRLAVSRFWTIPTPDDLEVITNNPENLWYHYYGQTFTPYLDSALYRDGKLWVEVRYNTAGFLGEADYFGIDPATFDTVRIRLAGQDTPVQNGGDLGLFHAGLPMRGMNHPFDVYQGYFYVALGTGDTTVRRYSLRDQTWEPVSLPVEGHIDVVRLADRLFFTTENSILECQPDGSYAVLASNRRQPAQNALDRVADYRGTPRLFLSADQSLNAIVGNDLYACSPAGHEWRRLATLPWINRAVYHPFDDGFIAEAEPRLAYRTFNGPPPPGDCWGMFGQLPDPVLLFAQTKRPGALPDASRPGQNSAATAPRWQDTLPGDCFCHQGDDLWFIQGKPKFFVNDSDQLQIQAYQGQEPRLVYLANGKQNTVTIPLAFLTENLVWTPPMVSALRSLANSPGPVLQTPWILLNAPPGMVVINNKIPGFWIIPQASLKQRLAAGGNPASTVKSANP